MENQHDLENKTMVYKRALEDIKVELTKKRSELGELAKQTVENLETSIPLLRDQISKLQGQLDILNKEIADKNEIYTAKQVDLDLHYQNLEGLLKNEYIKRKSELDTVEVSQNLRNEQQDRADQQLMLKSLQLDNRSAVLDGMQRTFDAQVESFSAQKAQSLKDITDSNDKAQAFLDSSKSLEAKSIIKMQDLKAQEDVLNGKIKDADAVLARIAEVQIILDQTNATNKESQEREITLNEINAKNIADTKRLNARESMIYDKEAKLLERENNIRAAEAAVKG